MPTPASDAIVAMGTLSDPINTFWQLFFRPNSTSRWTLATPPGVADNGGLVISPSPLAGAAFLASALVQAGTILTAGFALFPFLMPSSTYPNQSLTVWDASSSAKTLFIMLCAVVVFLPIVLVYSVWVFRVLKGRVTLDALREHEGPY